MYYEKAFKYASDDSRILYELDAVKQESGEESSEARLAFLQKHKKVVETRDDLLTSMLDLMVQQGQYREALDYYINHHFNNWEGRYSIHNSYMDACIGMANATKSPEEALELYLKACEYPKNLKVAPREPNLRGFLYYPMAQLYKKLNNSEEAERLLKITASESTDPPTLANYYQAQAFQDLGQTEQAEEILDKLFDEGKKRIEGDITNYENKDKLFIEALGNYYLSKVNDAKGKTDKANEFFKKAKDSVSLIEREAVIIAQIRYAGAKQ
jgi:tetratricopeptide (TPR) repeat protein